MDLSRIQRVALLDLARRSIVESLSGRSWTPAPPADPGLSQPAGCFVTLHHFDSHQLRGCVGRMEADRPLYEAVAEVAASVLQDPRFARTPVSLAELDHIDLEISVLSPLRPLASPTDFDLLDDGIYLKIGNETGVFLPQVARETGWSRDKLLDKLCTEKMGLAAEAWQDPAARPFAFSTVVIGPVRFRDGPVLA